MSELSFENSIGRKLQDDFRSFCTDAISMFSNFSFLEEPQLALQELEKSVIRPFNIAIFGRMKTGKSTLINSILGKNLAITGVEETTATINVISYAATNDYLESFTIHWKDAPPQTLPLETLQTDFCGKTDNVLDNVRRTSYIELYSPLEFLKLCEITDTPGTGSETVEHDQVTKNFFDATSKQGRKADAIIYVFPPVGRESDMTNLNTFRENNCIPGSDPYNSVAVLHKWDHIFWENGGDLNDIKQKAKQIYSAMNTLMADVIPVSAPMALAAANAPDNFFTEIVDLCRDQSWQDLEKFLSRDTKWCRDDKRKNILSLYNLPWATFQNIVREIALHIDDFNEISAIRNHIKDLSGIKSLILFLDQNFFKHSEIIRQKQKYAEIYRIKKQAYKMIQNKLFELDSDIEAWNTLFNMDLNNNKIVTWVSNKRYAAITEREKILELYKALDTAFLNSSIWQIIQDEEVSYWLENNALPKKIINQEQYILIKNLFTILAGNQIKNQEDTFFSDLELLQIHIAQLSNHPIKKIRDNFSHIKNRIDYFMNFYIN